MHHNAVRPPHHHAGEVKCHGQPCGRAPIALIGSPSRCRGKTQGDASEQAYGNRASRGEGARKFRIEARPSVGRNHHSVKGVCLGPDRVHPALALAGLNQGQGRRWLAGFR